MDVVGTFVAIPFGCLCLLLFMGLKGEADKARDTPRFYLIGFYRSVALALGIVALMAGISRLLSYYIP